MKKKYVVTLTQEERSELQRMISQGKAAARKLMHARILLQTDVAEDRPRRSDQAIAQSLNIARTTVERVRKQFVEEGFDAALDRSKPRRQYDRVLDGTGEAHLIALACSQAPEGRGRWTLDLLADRMVALNYVEAVSRSTVDRVLKKTNLSLG